MEHWTGKQSRATSEFLRTGRDDSERIITLQSYVGFSALERYD